MPMGEFLQKVRSEDLDACDSETCARVLVQLHAHNTRPLAFSESAAGRCLDVLMSYKISPSYVASVWTFLQSHDPYQPAFFLCIF